MAGSRTAELEGLRQGIVGERQRSREVALKAGEAQRVAEESRAGLVEAHAEGGARTIAKAEKALAVARAAAEQALVQAEGQELRSRRAEEAVKSFEATYARELIGELEPAAQKVVARLESSAAELVAAAQEWSAVSTRVTELLRSVPNARPAQDAPGSHALEAIARDLRKAFQAGLDIESPLPHWHYTQHVEAEAASRRAIRQEREGAAA